MTDRELIERAAKAAGIKIDKSPYNGGGRGNTGFDFMGNAVLDWHDGTKWNPLRNDSDALRLAIKLNIGIHHDHFAASIEKDWKVILTITHRGIDKDAATRRAIVRAAAAMADTSTD